MTLICWWLWLLTTLVCWERVPGPRRVEGTGQRLFWYSVCAGGANTENSTKMIEHDIFFQTVYGHMEWHADICKSLVYETYKEICCDKTNASPSSTRLEHSGSRGLSTHLWYLMEKEIHLLVIQKMRTITEKFVQKLLTFL